MKLIEAMKRLRLIEKKMGKNGEYISQYASMLSTEKPYFDTVTQQTQEVNSLVQANHDLFSEYLRLKKAIELTNLSTVVSVSNKTYSISELLVIKRTLGTLLLKTYNSLNDSNAERKMKAMQMFQGEKRPHVERLYSEKEKMAKLREWQDFLEEIDSRLEVVNATTDLQETA